MKAQLNIAVGFLLALACISPAQAAYIGWGVGSGGSLARTTDSGDTWTSFASNAGFHGAPFPNQPQLNALSFPDTQNGWITGNQGLMMHTANAGSTWTVQSSTTSQNL